MRRILLFFLLLALISFEANAQDWLPIAQNEKYHYISDSVINTAIINFPLLPSNNVILNDFQYGVGSGVLDNVFTISIDSPIIVGNTTYYKYVNRVTQCDTCSNLSVQISKPTDSTFLYPEIVQVGTGGYLLIFNQDTIELAPTPQNTYTIDSIQNISISTDSIFLDTWFYGTFVDSLASITVKSLTAPYPKLYRILLSKNYGITRVYKYDLVSQNPYLLFQMIGQEGSNYSLGYKQVRFQDIYNFNIGDQFYYHEYIFDGNPLWGYPTNVLEYWYRLKVIGRQDVAIDTIIYTFESVYYNQGYPTLTLNVAYTFSKSYILSEDRSFTMQEKEIRSHSEHYFYGNAICKDFFGANSVKYIGYDLGLTAQQTSPWGQDNYISAFNLVFPHTELYESIPTLVDDISILYSPGLGKSFEGYWHFEHTNIIEMVGFIKGNTALGSTPIVTILNQQKLESDEITFSVFPNPVTDLLKISVNSVESDLMYTIFNTEGKALLSISKENSFEEIIEIPVQNLTKGIYFLKIQQNGKVLENKKFVKK